MGRGTLDFPSPSDQRLGIGSVVNAGASWLIE